MKRWISYGIFFLCIPAVLIVGSTVFHHKQYAFISLALTMLSCIPFFLRFEKGQHNTVSLTLIAVMTALAVAGRILFGAIPFFKPVTAITILTALYFGSEAGYMTGALSAVLSNFSFGQGAWTPFQMVAWGLIGWVAGQLAISLRGHRWLLCLYGGVSGIVFSLIMDIYTVLWADNGFLWSRYGAVLATSLGVMTVYALSNVVFLLGLATPVGRKLERMQKRYGLIELRKS